MFLGSVYFILFTVTKIIVNLYPCLWARFVANVRGLLQNTQLFEFHDGEYEANAIKPIIEDLLISKN